MLQDIEDNILVYQLPQSGVSTVRDRTGEITTTYSYRKVLGPSTEASGRVTFSVSTNEVFANIDASDYVATIESGSGTVGTLIDVTAASPSLQSSLTQLSFNAPTGSNVKVSATVVKELAAERTKTLTNANITPNNPPTTINLGKCDCYQVTGIWTGTDNTGTSLMDRYTFNDGQRANLYDFGTLTLRPGTLNPTGHIYIEFQYFVHGGGDYFCVNSYQNFGGFDNWYSLVPSFAAQDGTVLRLRDCLDFRMKRDETDQVNLVYPSSGVGNPAKPNDDIITDFSYYLGRVDKLYLDSNGRFKVIKGTPSLKPLPPNDPTDGMVLAVLTYGPFTFGVKDVKIKTIDNRRYTMRDIGKLDRRITNIEY
jgi:hypothetical protein